MSKAPTTWTVADYDRAADEYLSRLPLEHFMEGIAQAKQREIALASLALLRARRPEVHSLNELLIQYFYKGRLRQVVPDNMILCSDQPLQAVKSFNLELEAAGPFLVMEWISDSPENRRKDREDSHGKYEKELKVPYCVMFDPARQQLQVEKHTGKRYEPVKPNKHGRYPIPELELEIGLLDGWVRFWYRGELLELPEALQGQLDQLRTQLEEWRDLAEKAQEFGDKEKKRADKEKKRAEKESAAKQKAESLAEQEKQRAEQEKQRADLLAAQVAQLQALLAQQTPPSTKGHP
jgi:Uma2 family endonuclease